MDPEDPTKVEAAVALSQALKKHGVKHAVIGGHAVRMLGSVRLTDDVDVLVHGDGQNVRNVLIAADSRFVRAGHKLVFQTAQGIVPIEILSGGAGAALQLPDVTTVPIIEIDSVSMLHPSLLICLKIRRWHHIADSERPQSRLKAMNDSVDIRFLLVWLVGEGKMVSFEGFTPEKKLALLQGFRLLMERFPETRPHIQSVLEPVDLRLVDPKK